MPITTQLNEKANIKLGTAADSLIAGRKIVSLEELQTSTLNQNTIIISGFAVDVANVKSLLVVIDGKILTEGSSNDFTLTSVSPNNTSNTISLTQSLPAGLNIKILYLGVVITNSASLDTLSPAMSDWVLNTGFGFSSQFGTPTDVNIYTRRVGDTLQVRGYLKNGSAATAGAAYLIMPPGMSIDATKFGSHSNVNQLGNVINNNATNSYPYAPTVVEAGFLYYDGSDTSKIWVAANTGTSGTDIYSAANTSFTSFWSISTYGFIEISIPIAGWSSNVIAQNSKVFKASSYAANGTNVISTPNALGQYRTYTKNASALTGTDNAPSGPYTPSVANGFIIDGSVPFASAGTSGQPNRIEIFIGQNKHPTIEAYTSAGRTGAVNLKVEPDSSTTFYGVSFDYDSASGVMIVDAIEQPTSTTTRWAARSMPFNGSAPVDMGVVYFDINVSDNVLPVQFSDPSKVAHNEVFVYGGSGHGSTDTFVRWLSTIVTNIGTAISVFSNSVNGTYFVINEPGIYAMAYEDASSAGASAGITKNSPFLNTAVSDVTQDPYRLISTTVSGAASQQPAVAPVTTFLQVGDIIRPMNDSSTTPNGTANNGTNFRIIKIANG